MEILIRAVAGLFSRLRRMIFRARGVQIPGAVWLRRVSIPQNPWDIRLEAGVALDDGVTLLAIGSRQNRPRIVIGASTYVNRNTIIDASEQIAIGRSVLIGPGCYITDHDHGLQDRTALVGRPTVIEDGAWLGAHVVILKGVRVGRQAIIAAGSVVNRSIPPRCVAAGVPARVVKSIDQEAALV